MGVRILKSTRVRVIRSIRQKYGYRRFGRSRTWHCTTRCPKPLKKFYTKQCVLAGWKSVLENHGKPVRLTDVSEDWESPAALPNHPDHDTVSLFQKKFGDA